MDSTNENVTPTPEMSEEAKLRAKYGGALPRQKNLLTKKIMTKPKFFDSGDYNLAKAQGKLDASKPNSTTIQINPPDSTPIDPEMITGHEIPTPETVMPRKLSCASSMPPPSAQ